MLSAHDIDTRHLKPISSKCSILSCERLLVVFLPFWILLYAVLMLPHQFPNKLLTNMAVSKLLFECYQIKTVLLKYLIIVNTAPLEADLF